MNISSKQIKQWVLTEGFQKVGIASAKLIPHSQHKLKDWLQMGNHASMEWIKKREKERGDVREYFPAAKSIISVGLNYYTGFSQDALSSAYQFSNYAWGDDYHIVMKSKLFKVLKKNKRTGTKFEGIGLCGYITNYGKGLGTGSGIGLAG